MDMDHWSGQMVTNVQEIGKTIEFVDVLSLSQKVEFLMKGKCRSLQAHTRTCPLPSHFFFYFIRFFFLGQSPSWEWDSDDGVFVLHGEF